MRPGRKPYRDEVRRLASIAFRMASSHRLLFNAAAAVMEASSTRASSSP